MEALVLDFDGVISDSAREAFLVALATDRDLRPEAASAQVLARVDPEHPERDPLYARFLEIMPLGNRAEDYGVALRALEADTRLADQEAYDRFRDALDPAFLEAFHRRFYEVRADWQERDPAGWRRLLAPYPEVLGFLRRAAPRRQLAIATSKDRHSVGALLADYGIADLFPPERVLDKETGRSKTAHLRHLHRELGLALPELFFVDDKVNHLDAVAALGVPCGLATWGYNTAREHALARDHGHLLLTLASLDARLLLAPLPGARGNS